MAATLVLYIENSFKLLFSREKFIKRFKMRKQKMWGLMNV